MGENTWTQRGEHHTLRSVERGGQGGITWGEMPDVCDGGMKAANHIAMCVLMQQSCMICTCTPEPKVQLKTKKPTKISHAWWQVPVIPATRGG